MRGVGEHAQDPAIERHHRKGGGRNGSAEFSKQPTADKKQHDRRRQIHQKQAGMDARWRLAEDGQKQAVGIVRARELHVVGQVIRWDTLKDELAGVRVLAFVSFERHAGEAQANGCCSGADHQRDGQGRRLQSPWRRWGAHLRRGAFVRSFASSAHRSAGNRGERVRPHLASLKATPVARQPNP